MAKEEMGSMKSVSGNEIVKKLTRIGFVLGEHARLLAFVILC